MLCHATEQVVTGVSMDRNAFKVWRAMMSQSKAWAFQKPCCENLKLIFMGQKSKANCKD